jgi:ectoine hydroxylase-related dioxygenase (phytanoyl-CoA dioxygenase family)
MSPTTPLAELLPTDEEIAHYRETGVYLSRRIVPEDVLDRALHGMERFYRSDHDRPFPGATRSDDHNWRPERGGGLRKNDYARYQVRELDELVRYPTIAAVAAVLAGVESIRLWHDQLLYKPPQRPDAVSTVGWHTDRQYWRTCTSTEMLTAWVPLVDVDETIGTVRYIVGSHRWDEAELVAGLDFFDADHEEQERLFSDGRHIEKISATLTRGQVAFHHCRTIHGSGPNLADRVRRSVAIHLQPGDNRYQRAVGIDGEPAAHRIDELVRSDPSGLPDYTDPRICPVLWPREGSESVVGDRSPRS